jgi:hypothetical protein
MYVDVLSDALRTWNGGLSGGALLDRVVDSRVFMLSARLGCTPSAYDLLAAEVAYDAALIRLCDDLGISTGAADFADPLAERTRIEQMLAETRGLDLSALARARRQT